MESRERNHVHSQLAQVAVQLPREANATGDPRHRRTHQMVQISVGRSSQLQSPEANVIQSFVVHCHHLIRVFHKLVERQHRVVRLYDSVGHLRGRDHRKTCHDTIGVLLPNLGNQQRAHSGTRASSQGVGDLETLQAVTSLCLLSHNVQHRIDRIIKHPPCSVPWPSCSRLQSGQTLPAPVWPNTKLSGRNSCPKGPARTESMVPGFKSIRIARGTYRPPVALLQCTLIRSSCRSESPW
mmetsp:Transcript_81442/g.217847  ORF Transcript_81442/g.217847 Transcript_81442/m.217847 type:complete len:239 (+) Transcript_81442:604-1320(+)